MQGVARAGRHTNRVSHEQGVARAGYRRFSREFQQWVRARKGGGSSRAGAHSLQCGAPSASFGVGNEVRMGCPGELWN
eukprot:366422-Chlamydomonas_euryale.AAC.1